jgi:two-component system CheB/CheR fusion protein
VAAAEHRPDIVLLDIGLPGMDGYQVAQQLRQVPGMEKALLIAVTGYGQEQDRGRSQAAGFDHYLVKPVDLEALQSQLAGAGE